MQQEILAGVVASLSSPNSPLNASNLHIITLLRDAFYNQNTLNLVQNTIDQHQLELALRKRKMEEDEPMHHFTDHWGLQNMSLVQLKQICKGINLSVSGRKRDLIKRIIQGKKTKGHQQSKRMKRFYEDSSEFFSSDSETMMMVSVSSSEYDNCPILSIPLEVQSLILSFLPTMDLLANVPLVCTAWNRLVNNKGYYSVWKFIESIDLVEIPRLSSYKLRKVLSLGGYQSMNNHQNNNNHHHHLSDNNNTTTSSSTTKQSLLLHNVKRISLGEIEDDALLELGVACPQLEQLEMSIGLLSARPTFSFPKMTSLSLSFSPMGFQPGKLLPSLENCPNLLHLTIKDNAGCPYRWVTSVLQKSTLCPSLKTIELIDWQPDDYFTEMWPSLEQLQFRSTEGSGRDRLNYTFFVSAKTPQLSCIEITNCTLQASLFDCFVKANPKLNTLVIRDCDIIDYDRWVSPSTSAAITDLTFDNCNVSAELLASLCNQVERLSLSRCAINKGLLNALQGSSSSLRELNLQDCTGVQNSLQALVHLPKLQVITLPVSVLRSKNTLVELFRTASQLRVVNFVQTSSSSSSSPQPSFARNLQALVEEFPSVHINGTLATNMINCTSHS